MTPEEIGEIEGKLLVKPRLIVQKMRYLEWHRERNQDSCFLLRLCVFA